MRIGSASLIDPFRSSIARPTDALVYASKETSRSPPQDSGSGWSRFLLSCRDSSSPATCRFIPAHPQTRLETATLPLTAEGKRMPEYWSFRAIFDALAVPRMADRQRDSPGTKTRRERSSPAGAVEGDHRPDSGRGPPSLTALRKRCSVSGKAAVKSGVLRTRLASSPGSLLPLLHHP